MPLTSQSISDKQEVIQSQAEGEEYKHPVVVVAYALPQPHAVVVKPTATAIAQLAVLGPVGDDNLGGGENSQST